MVLCSLFQDQCLCSLPSWMQHSLFLHQPSLFSCISTQNRRGFRIQDYGQGGVQILKLQFWSWSHHDSISFSFPGSFLSCSVPYSYPPPPSLLQMQTQDSVPAMAPGFCSVLRETCGVQIYTAHSESMQPVWACNPYSSGHALFSKLIWEKIEQQCKELEFRCTEQIQSPGTCSILSLAALPIPAQRRSFMILAREVQTSKVETNNIDS